MNRTIFRTAAVAAAATSLSIGASSFSGWSQKLPSVPLSNDQIDDLKLLNSATATPQEKGSALIRLYKEKSGAGDAFLTEVVRSLSVDRELQKKLLYNASSYIFHNDEKPEIIKLGLDVAKVLAKDPAIDIPIGHVVSPIAQSTNDWARHALVQLADEPTTCAHQKIHLLIGLSNEYDRLGSDAEIARSTLKRLTFDPSYATHLHDVSYCLAKVGSKEDWLEAIYQRAQQAPKANQTLSSIDYEARFLVNDAKVLTERGQCTELQAVQMLLSFSKWTSDSALQRSLFDRLAQDYPEQATALLKNELIEAQGLDGTQSALVERLAANTVSPLCPDEPLRIVDNSLQSMIPFVSLSPSTKTQPMLPLAFIELARQTAGNFTAEYPARINSILALGRAKDLDGLNALTFTSTHPMHKAVALARLLAGDTSQAHEALEALPYLPTPLLADTLKACGDNKLTAARALIAEHLWDWKADYSGRSAVTALKAMPSAETTLILKKFCRDFIEWRKSPDSHRDLSSIYTFADALDALKTDPEIIDICGALSNSDHFVTGGILDEMRKSGDPLACYLMLEHQHSSLDLKALPEPLALAQSIRNQIERAPSIRTQALNYAALLERAVACGITRPYRLYPRDLKKVLEVRLDRTFDPSSPQFLYLTGQYDKNGALNQKIGSEISELHSQGITVWYYELQRDRITNEAGLIPQSTFPGAIKDVRESWTQFQNLKFTVVLFHLHGFSHGVALSEADRPVDQPTECDLLDVNDIQLIRDSGIFSLCDPRLTTIVTGSCNASNGHWKDDKLNFDEALRIAAGEQIAPKHIIGPVGLVANATISFSRHANIISVGFMNYVEEPAEPGEQANSTSSEDSKKRKKFHIEIIRTQAH